MLSIGAMAPGQAEYYLNLAREDYYLEGGEPPGLWVGAGAAKLALDGHVKREQLERLLRGHDPRSDTPVVQIQQGRRHQPGWDLTFSAPKSVSVLWSQASPELRESLQSAQLAAVRAAVSYLEETAAVTRRGAGGKTREACGLIVAAFEHGTSRAQDPQLHTHALVMNVGARADGTFGTIVSRELYRNKMSAGAVYRLELAHQLTIAGLQLRRGRHTFEIAGVPDGVCDAFSTRRKEIVDALAREGFRGAKAAELAAFSTRQTKGHVARAELFARWQEMGRVLGFSREEADRLRATRATRPELDREHTSARRPDATEHRDAASTTRAESGRTQDEEGRRERTRPSDRGPERQSESVDESGPNSRRSDARVDEPGALPRGIKATLRNVVAKLSRDRSHFSESDVSRALAKAVEHQGIPARRLSGVVSDFVHHSGELEPVREVNRRPHYATRELAAAERKLLHAAAASRTIGSHMLPDVAVGSVISRRGLPAEQAAALRHITSRQGSIQCLSGIAGSGKTSVLAAANELWENAGYRVIGCTLAARAARQLESDTGIRSLTLRSLSWRLSPPLKAQLKHHARQLVRAARKMKTYPVGRLTLDRKTVVVLDEASMVDSVTLSQLGLAVASANAKLVVAGDYKQRPPIEAGGPLRALTEVVGTAELTRIKRQRHAWMREAVQQFADGDVHTALALYAKAGRLHVQSTLESATYKLTMDWNRKRTPDLSETLILAGTRENVGVLNRLAQELRRLEGELGSRSINVGEKSLFEGDRVLFTANDHALGVVNGDFGVVEKIRGVVSSRITPLVVRLDRQDQNGKQIRVTFSPLQSKGLDLGYAITTDKAQGATVERTFVLAGGWMQDRELSYVQMSRHRDDAHIYTSRAEAGEDLERLGRSMSRSRQRETAVDHTPYRPLREEEIAR